VARRISALRVRVPCLGSSRLPAPVNGVGRPQSSRDCWHMGRCGAPEGPAVDPVCDHMGPVELWRVRGEGEASGMIMVFFFNRCGAVPCVWDLC
jgi:hypothetical protein